MSPTTSKFAIAIVKMAIKNYGKYWRLISKIKMLLCHHTYLRVFISVKNLFSVTIIGTNLSLIALCQERCQKRALQNTTSKNCAGTAQSSPLHLAFWQLHNERASECLSPARFPAAPLTSLPSSTIEMKDARR